MILAIGDVDDASLRYVAWLAELRGVDVRLLAEDELGVSWAVGREASADRWWIEIGDDDCDLGDVTGVVVRLNPRPEVPASLGLVDDDEAFFVIERRSGLHWFLDHVPLRVANRPGAGRSNGSKPLHMVEIAAAGLRVPRWCATNDPDAADAFIGGCRGGVVYKAASGLRSHVRSVDAALARRLAEGTTPVVLQERVGEHDARLHVVGSTVFGTAVRSSAVDYRFDDEAVEYRPIDPPADVARRCRDLTASEGLTISGIDFRVDAAGAWWCLEMNPVPTFLPYEAGSGHMIGDRLVDELAAGTAAPHAESPLVALDDATRNSRVAVEVIGPPRRDVIVYDG